MYQDGREGVLLHGMLAGGEDRWRSTGRGSRGMLPWEGGGLV